MVGEKKPERKKKNSSTLALNFQNGNELEFGNCFTCSKKDACVACNTGMFRKYLYLNANSRP